MENTLKLMVFSIFMEESKMLYNELSKKKELTDKEKEWMEAHKLLIDFYDQNNDSNKEDILLAKEDVIVLNWNTSVSSGSRRFYIKHPKSLEKLEEIKEKYKKSGVSFEVVREISNSVRLPLDKYTHVPRR